MSTTRRGYRFIRLYLSKVDEQFSLGYGEEDSDFDSLLERQKRACLWVTIYESDTNRFALSPQGYEVRKATFKRAQKITKQQQRLHPTRDASYILYPDVRKHYLVCKLPTDNTDYMFLEWIRKISKVVFFDKSWEK